MSGAVQAFDSKALAEMRRQGYIPSLMESIQNELGIVSMAEHRDGSGRIGFDEMMAWDAPLQAQLVTVPNAGIPALLSTHIDTKLIQILVAPMRAAEAVGSERKVGDWTRSTEVFVTMEHTGEVATYGDYSTNGSVEANVNFPQRQSYHYQTFTQWGEKQLATMALANIDYAAQLRVSSALILSKFQNYSYLFGITNLQNYGLTNDPTLPAPIAPTYSWLTNSSATALTVYQDIVRLFIQLLGQANGLVDALTSMTLIMSPQQEAALNFISQYNVNVKTSLAANYPNLKIVSVPEFATTSGQLMMLIADEVEGQRTVETAFTEKMRMHNLVTETSSWKQKCSQGTWGTIIYRPMLIAMMLG